VRAEIVAALDEWASITEDPARRAWLLAVARGADPNPSRDRLRQPELWQDGPRLAKLVKEMRVHEFSPQLATALGRVLFETRGENLPLLSAAQARHPQDFWLNFELGWAMYQSRRFSEALGFHRAALALRPKASPALSAIGITLIRMNRAEEAIIYLEEALKIDKSYVIARSSLGSALYLKGLKDQAIDQFQEAIRLDPELTGATRHELGVALWAKGKKDEAILHLRESVRLDPKEPMAHNCLGTALRETGQLDEAIDHFEQAIQLDPKASADVHSNLALALYRKAQLDRATYRARLDEAIGHLEQAIELAPHYSGARSNLCNCLYLAARAALRASTGESSQNTRPGEKERAGLRCLALDRLRASLELRIRLHDDEKTARSRWSLAPWLTDPTLASVREPAALAKLPDAERAEWQRLWTDVAAQLAADPVQNGMAQAARRDWAKAAAFYGRMTGRRIEDSDLWFEHAALLHLSGDRAGYAKACARMVKEYGQTSDLRPYHVARACTLAPDAVMDLALPGQLADAELKTHAGKFWSLTEQGALHYRAGRFQQAAALFEQSLLADSKPGRAVLNWLWLALANQRLGKPEEARQWLDRATTWLDQFPDGMPKDADQKYGLHLHNWLEAHVLRREADALIRPTNPR
jgi:tetratricopeptide (TPR) repeat protein